MKINIYHEPDGTVKITKEEGVNLEQVMCINLPIGLKYSIDVTVANLSSELTIIKYGDNE